MYSLYFNFNYLQVPQVCVSCNTGVHIHVYMYVHVLHLIYIYIHMCTYICMYTYMYMCTQPTVDMCINTCTMWYQREPKRTKENQPFIHS